MRKLHARRRGSPYRRRTENYQENAFVILVKQAKIIQLYINACVCVFLHMVFTSNAVKKKPVLLSLFSLTEDGDIWEINSIFLIF